MPFKRVLGGTIAGDLDIGYIKNFSKASMMLLRRVECSEVIYVLYYVAINRETIDNSGTKA